MSNWRHSKNINYDMLILKPFCHLIEQMFDFSFIFLCNLPDLVLPIMDYVISFQFFLLVLP